METSGRSIAMSHKNKIMGSIIFSAACVGAYSHLFEKAAGAASPPEAIALTSIETASKEGGGRVLKGSAANVKFRDLQERLTNAEAKSAEYKSYTTMLELQEYVRGNLHPCETIKVKIRREPFSVYMRWEDKDQEALFVEGQNDNRMLVRPTKALATLRRVWRLDPDSRMAKQSCRYPVTDSGLEKLVIRTREFYEVRNDWAEHVACAVSSDKLGEVDVEVFEIQFKKMVSRDFSRSRYFFDEQRGLMIGVENYGWAEGDNAGSLVERYAYHAIDAATDLEDEDFDHENPAYAFVAR